MMQITSLTIALLSAVVGLSACSGDSSITLNSVDPVGDAIESGAESNSLTESAFNTENTSTPNTNLPDATDTVELTRTELDGRWQSNCVAAPFEQNPIQFEQELIEVEGRTYKRTINSYQDSDCSVPADISFLSVSSTDLQYLGSSVQTVKGAASQIDFTPNIEFDRTSFTGDDAGLFDPYLKFYDFYFLGLDGFMYFGSMDTFPEDEFEQTLDSPHVFTAQ